MNYSVDRRSKGLFQPQVGQHINIHIHSLLQKLLIWLVLTVIAPNTEGEIRTEFAATEINNKRVQT